jgi:hypothetical protein
MKHLLAAVALATAIPALAADVGVSISISQPGVYGRVDIGRFPQPIVIAQQPVLVVPAPRAVVVQQPVVVQPEPVYMWVPPAHRDNWHRYCGRYNACGTPVYFVRDDWYAQKVRGRGNGRGRDRDEDRGERGDRGDRGERGNGHGRGHDSRD